MESHSNGVTLSRYCSDQSISWPDLSIYFGHPNQRSLGLESCSTIPTDSLEKKHEVDILALWPVTRSMVSPNCWLGSIEASAFLW